MRFIVDLYRYIIVAFCGVAVVGGAVLLFAGLDPDGPLAGAYPAWAIAVAAVVAIMFVLSIGGLALLISLHDRHAALADATQEAASALQVIARNVQYRDSRQFEA